MNQETRKTFSLFCDANREVCKQYFMFIGGYSPYQHNEVANKKKIQNLFYYYVI